MLPPPSLVTRKKDEDRGDEEEDDSQCIEGHEFGWIYEADTVHNITEGGVK